ncbi:hypothetical protein SAMN04487770_11618 [Butyrivibrio sp. ob235]|uniref:hypothetical protein n=1 Tax=Butyrivibrio sp. ob235 TaxID=1761780 RepID=UPI0008B8113E|nr:hypothetical protein [Butyrivibrio sp. ob235]SEL73106.1 hypothetical protein SAMN04487770_11618 [Butyrivibrio sp. ob235]
MIKKTFISISTLLIVILLLSSFSQPVNAQDYNPTPIELDRDNILYATSDSYSSNDVIHWTPKYKYSSDVHDGTIPVSLLNDPVYCSMNLPSESQSDFMKSAGRDNGHILCNMATTSYPYMCSIGAIYLTSGQELPQTFSIYLGNIKLFAYSKSKKAWLTLDNLRYPSGIFIYTLPWSSTKATKCNHVTYSANYAKIDLTSEEMSSACLHFWGKIAPIDNDDYLYYASAFTFWVDSNSVDKFTATGGIDTKTSLNGTGGTQVFSTRGLSSSTTPKILWGHTVPNSEYKACNASILNQLYAGTVAEDYYLTLSQSNNVEENIQSNSNEADLPIGSSALTEDALFGNSSASIDNVKDFQNIDNQIEPSTYDQSSNGVYQPQGNNAKETVIPHNNASQKENKDSKPQYTNKDVTINNLIPTKDDLIDPTQKNSKISSVRPGKNCFNITWKKQKVSGYQIQYSTNKSFTKFTKTISIKSAATASKSIKNIKSSNKIYIRIRTYVEKGDKIVYSKWSKPTKMKTH